VSEDKPSGQRIDVSGLRRPASGQTLDREDLDDSPFVQFEHWLSDACEAEPLDPNAMSIATVTSDGQPYCRTVLLKHYDEKGFVFYTNHESNKARHIAQNGKVALLFFWRSLGRQIGIRGTASRISKTETLKYFLSRPRGSQIGAWVSAQSSIITSRSHLEAQYAEMKQKFADREIPLPSFWGGYRVVPHELEFWQSRDDRLHDRFLYSREDEGWRIERLAP
jgi:pyridoxamine 5'-phosphate oxidase